MARIGIVTTTRAEYGLLEPLRKDLISRQNADVFLLVTGTHFSKEYGYTFREIEDSQCSNVIKLPVEFNGADAHETSVTMAHVLIRFSEHFQTNKYDFIVVLGDRYETMAVCIAATHHHIPIVHIHGGETTEGAIDEAMRHSITKMSYLHFTSLEEYRNRVIQLGEKPERVFCVGALGVENIMKAKLLSREELSESLHFELEGEYGVVTFHPITLENTSIEEQVEVFQSALDEFSTVKFIITKANADTGGSIVNDMLEQYAQTHKNVFFIDSLGMQRYLSALKYCSFVLGNSSSGIIEAPSFGIATINIGDRQRGRIQADSVINVNIDKEEIVQGIQRALIGKKQKEWKNTKNPYGDGKTSSKIADIIMTHLENKPIDLKKEFYNLKGN